MAKCLKCGVDFLPLFTKEYCSDCDKIEKSFKQGRKKKKKVSMEDIYELLRQGKPVKIEGNIRRTAKLLLEAHNFTDVKLNVRRSRQLLIAYNKTGKVDSSIWLQASIKKQEKRGKERIDFLRSPEWRRLRYEALKRYKQECACCGRTRKHGIVLHVDHIKPRSKYPKLALDIENLQILCEDCNLGKGNLDEIDWRITNP